MMQSNETKLINAIKNAYIALQFYADEKNYKYLYGVRDWKTDRDNLSSRNFSLIAEGSNGGEEWLEDGTVARIALSKLDKTLDELNILDEIDNASTN